MTGGRRFYKMSGSGNDFIFFDLRDGAAADLENEKEIRSLCARGTGVGADGVVFYKYRGHGDVEIRYYNSDGSVGELCGNATLCTVRLTEHLGEPVTEDLTIHTDAGTVPGRLLNGQPEIDLEPVSEVTTDWSAIPRGPGERQLGFALAGVPHVAIEVANLDSVDVIGRGSAIRRDQSLSAGANVNFLAPGNDGSWRIRTYERGVEGETLACGTGAVASAILLAAWGRAEAPVRLVTKSGRELVVRLQLSAATWLPSLSGPADLIFTGLLEASERT